jgi:hypothetical protein
MSSKLWKYRGPSFFLTVLCLPCYKNRLPKAMRSVWNMNAVAKPRIVRWLAVLFLLFMLVDIASPPACCENAEMLSAARDYYPRPVAEARNQDKTIPISSESGSEQSPDKNCCDEDCCLFCAHMLTVKARGAEFVPDRNSPLAVLNEAPISSPLVDAIYHPPRFL